MLRLIAFRCLFAFATLWVVSLVVFLAVELLPGDACEAFLGQMAQGQRLENCRVEHRLNESAHVRYLAWAEGLAQGDLGNSIKRSKPLENVIGPRFRNTLILGLTAAALGIPLAIFLGVLAALWRDKRADLLISSAAIFFMTIPEFITGTLLISFFSVYLGWLPGIVIMRVDAPISEVFTQIGLPVLTLMRRGIFSTWPLVGQQCLHLGRPSPRHRWQPAFAGGEEVHFGRKGVGRLLMLLHPQFHFGSRL